MKSKLKLKNKIKLLIGTGLLISGVSASVLLTLTYLKKKQFVYNDLGKFTWAATTNSQDVIDAINANEKLMSYKEESVEFLKSKVYTYDLRILGLTNEEASADAFAQAAAYEKEFCKILSKYYDEEYFDVQKKSLSSPFITVYSELKQLNEQYDISPIDFYQLQNVLLPQIEDEICRITASSANQQKTNKKFNLFKSQLKEKILGEHLNSFHFSRLLASTLNDEGLTDKKDIELVSSQVMKMVSDRALILNENPEIDFVGLLTPYSIDGKTGYSEKEKKNILSQDDLNKLFLAKRDYLGDSPLLEPGEAPNNNSNNGTKTEPVKPECLPLDKYIPKAEGLPSFAKNEIVPGYTLQAKIISLDYTTDSNIAKLGFQLGISKTGDFENKINWITSGGENNSNEEYLWQEFKVSSFEEKLNCATNFFYPNELKLSYKNENFDATKISKRTTITNLLSDAPSDENDHYTFNEKNPYIVDTESLELPGIVKPHQLENNHANEKIMLAVTKANTNYIKQGTLEDLLANKELVKNYSDAYRFKNLIPYIEAKWVLVDNEPNSGSYRVIREYEWTNSIGNKQTNTLPIYFPYSNEELALLQQGNMFAKFIHDFYILSYGDDDREKNLAKNIQTTLEVSSGMDMLLSGVLIGSSALEEFCSILSAADLLSLGFSAVNVAIDSFLAYNGIKTCKTKRDMIPAIEQLSNLVEKFKTCVPKDVAKIFAGFYDKLNDENLTVSAKLKIATIASTYIFAFLPTIFEFFDFATEQLFDDKDLLEEEKNLSQTCKENTRRAKSWMVYTLEQTDYPKYHEYTESDFNNEFLNYHNEDVNTIYKRVNVLESVEDLSNKSQSLEKEMFVNFSIQAYCFTSFGMGVIGGVCGGRVLNIIGSQLKLWSNIEGKNIAVHNVYTALYTEVPECAKGKQIEAPRDVLFCKAFEDRYTEKWKNLLEESPYTKKEIHRYQRRAEAYYTRYEEDYFAPKINKYKDNVMTEEEFGKYLKRKNLSPTMAKFTIGVTLITIAVGVGQVLIDNLEPVIPEDKVWVMQETQNSV